MKACLFEATYTTGRFGFQELLWPLRGEVTLFCRLLVMLRLLRLVALVFTSSCLELLLFLLFEVILVECAISMTGHTDFHSVLLWTAVISPFRSPSCWMCDLYDWLHWFSSDVLCNTLEGYYCLYCYLLYFNGYFWSYWLVIPLVVAECGCCGQFPVVLWTVVEKYIVIYILCYF